MHKQGVGTDNIAVGWTVGGLVERPIPASRLLPYASKGEAMVSAVDGKTQSEGGRLYSQINVYPNPAQSGDPELTLSDYNGIQGPIETQVDIRTVTGDIVFSERVSCGGGCGAYVMKINKLLVTGLYIVSLKTNGIRHSKRLLIK